MKFLILDLKLAKLLDQIPFSFICKNLPPNAASRPNAALPPPNTLHHELLVEHTLARQPLKPPLYCVLTAACNLT